MYKKFKKTLLFLLFTSTLFGQSLNIPLTFNIAPEMYASFMAKSLEPNLPKEFNRDGLSLVVQKVYAQDRIVFFEATTKQYKRILDELYRHKTLPLELAKDCKSFSQMAMVDKGVEYRLSVVDGTKSFVVVYDSEACLKSFDPVRKIFIDGYNRYGFDMNGKTKKENSAKNRSLKE